MKLKNQKQFIFLLNLEKKITETQVCRGQFKPEVRIAAAEIKVMFYVTLSTK